MNNCFKYDLINKRDFSLTFIQVICALSVVTLHTNGCFWTFSATERYWFTANIIESTFYFAVPVFFMITGITLIDYQDRYSTLEFFKRRAKKTLLPYVAWSFIGILFLLATNRISIETITPKWVLNGLLSSNGIINIYWFFKPLFCVYLCIPLFASINKAKKNEIIKYLLGIGFIVKILLPFLINVFKLEIEWPYRISDVFDYLFWSLGGVFIWKNTPTKKQKFVIYFLAISGLLLHIFGTYFLSVSNGSIQYLYKGYLNVPCVLYSFGVFILMKDIAGIIENFSWLKKLFNILGQYTFPVYLIHWFILRIVNDLVTIDTKSIFYRLLMPYAIYIVIIVIVWCMRKIPIIKNIVP